MLKECADDGALCRLRLLRAAVRRGRGQRIHREPEPARDFLIGFGFAAEIPPADPRVLAAMVEALQERSQQAWLLARDAGKPYDAAEFDRVVGAADSQAVKDQVAAGVSVVSDGELGKVGYSTYMIERLSGFGGHIDRKPAADLAEVPNLAKKLSAIMGSQEFVRASCIGEVKLVTLEPLHDDIRRFKAALAKNGTPATEAFMNAASPGLITAFQVNRFYPSHEAYLADLIEAMRPSRSRIANSTSATGHQNARP